MADDTVDISGMPDPGSIGLGPKQPAADPTVGMPDPEDLYRKYYFGGSLPNANGKYGPIEPIPKDSLDEFMANPPHVPTARETGSRLTGLPRAAAGYAMAVPAGVASIAGQASGALGAALDPSNASDYLEQGRDRGRAWSAKVSNLANYVPATKLGGELSNDLMSVPGEVIKGTAGKALKSALPDNAYQAVSDIATDVSNDLPALGLPEAARATGRVIPKAVGAVKNALKPDVIPEGTTYDAAGTAQRPSTALTPDVGTPISGDTLRAQPNPIPAPEGTIHNEVHPAALPPKAAAVEPPTAPAEPPAAAPTEATGQEPPAQPPAPAAAAAPSPGDAQRGSVRLFNSPAEEGPKETPAPEQQNERQGHLDDLDRLSGGQLPTRRTSALTGDYNATGDDWQMKQAGNETMQKQIASENAAMHGAADNVHNSIGSEFGNSVDSQTLDDRGRVTRNAIQGIEKWFNDATDQMYDKARTANQGRQIGELQRVKAYLNDDSNFANDAEIGLQRAAKQRLDRLWSTGDPDKGVPPGSVNAAEKFREFLNEKGGNPNAWGVAKAMKDHLDADVAEKGGPGLFETARNMRTHQFRMLEEPTGIRKLLTPSDSQGINHQIPTHKVMDYIADLPSEQHAQVLNVLRAGAHLGGGELAEASASAIKEIQAHVLSRMQEAARDDGGKWNARSFYSAANRYSRNANELFKDRPDVLRNLKTLNDAGNTLHMDKSYPGAAAQTVRSGLAGAAVKAGGNLAASLAHDIPVVGRIIGRKIEGATEKATGEMGKAAQEKAAAARTVDRNGKQRGSVGVLPQRDAINHVSRPDEEGTLHRYTVPDKGGSMHVMERPELGVSQVQSASVTNKGQGWGTRMLQRAADDAHARGQTLRSDSQVSEGQAGAYANLKKLGYDVVKKPSDLTGGAYHAVGDHVFEVRPQKANGATLNVGLHQGTPGEAGFRKMSKQEATGAVESTGARVTKSSVLTPEAHGVSEPTMVASINRQLSEPEMQKVLAKTKQSAIPQRTDAGVESMHIAPGHEAIAKEQGWDKFNPDYFRDHEGQPLGAKIPGQRGAFNFTNDNALNNGNAGARGRQTGGKVERNPRTEYNANSQMAGGRQRLSAEQNDILGRLMGGSQRGSVRVMNEKPLTGAPEGDRPNGAARAVAKAYAKTAGIDYKPLDEYRYVDPTVAKNVAKAYDEMKHDPSDPKVAKSYAAFKAETLAQYKQMMKAGVKVDLDESYPYKNPREMHEDVRANNHMSVYPTEAGFGSEGAPPSDHPLLEKAPIKIGGKDATYNDLFRAVHDYYGHAAEGNGFRANGEYNAWRAHRQMYSPEARGAMDAETLGQNSWVNSGPAGVFNKNASGADTIFADQKAGLLPKAVVKSAEEGVGQDEHHITNQLTDKERAQLRSDTTKRLIDAFNSTPATKEYAAAALAGAAKRGWYRDSAQAIVNQFGHEAPRFAGLLSAMSPQVSVQTNFANALKTYINWDKAGRPQEPAAIRSIMEESSQKSAKATPGSSNVLDAWVGNAVRALTADDPENIQLSGPKVHSFYNNLTDKVHEVTNDAWMAAFAKIDPVKLGGGLNKAGPGKSPTYLALSGKVRQAASMLSRLTGETWTPAEVQETVWSWAKTAYEHAEEKGDRSIPELVKNGDITDDLIRSTPDFHQLFGTSEHRGLLQSSRFAGNDAGVASGTQQGANAARTSQARKAAEAALRPHLISAAERLEQVRQERRAAGRAAPKEEE